MSDVNSLWQFRFQQVQRPNSWIPTVSCCLWHQSLRLFDVSFCAASGSKACFHHLKERWLFDAPLMCQSNQMSRTKIHSWVKVSHTLLLTLVKLNLATIQCKLKLKVLGGDYGLFFGLGVIYQKSLQEIMMWCKRTVDNLQTSLNPSF